MLRVVLRVVERKASVLRNDACRRAHSSRVLRGIVTHLLRLCEIVDWCAALRPARHGDDIPAREPSHRLVHRHVPARYPRTEVHRREIAPFVRLLLLVAVFVRPRLESFADVVELGAELPFARPEALVDFHLRGVRHPPARDCDIHLALRTASKARASPSCRARDVAYALCARRLAVEKPFAALSDHDARIGRAYRAAKRTVDRRAKELRGKCAARGVPLRDAARERVRLCNPEEALGIKRNVRNIVHSIRVPLAGEPPPALAADAADLASVLHYFHLMVWCTGRDILGAVRRDGAHLKVA